MPASTMNARPTASTTPSNAPHLHSARYGVIVGGATPASTVNARLTASTTPSTAPHLHSACYGVIVGSVTRLPF